MTQEKLSSNAAHEKGSVPVQLTMRDISTLGISCKAITGCKNIATFRVRLSDGSKEDTCPTHVLYLIYVEMFAVNRQAMSTYIRVETCGDTTPCRNQDGGCNGGHVCRIGPDCANPSHQPHTEDECKEPFRVVCKLCKKTTVPNEMLLMSQDIPGYVCPCGAVVVKGTLVGYYCV